MSRKRGEKPEEQPQSGGSYIRQSDGSLVQVAGPGIDPADADAGEPAAPEHAAPQE